MQQSSEDYQSNSTPVTNEEETKEVIESSSDTNELHSNQNSQPDDAYLNE